MATGMMSYHEEVAIGRELDKIIKRDDWPTLDAYMESMNLAYFGRVGKLRTVGGWTIAARVVGGHAHKCAAMIFADDTTDKPMEAMRSAMHINELVVTCEACQAICLLHPSRYVDTFSIAYVYDDVCPPCKQYAADNVMYGFFARGGGHSLRRPDEQRDSLMCHMWSSKSGIPSQTMLRRFGLAPGHGVAARMSGRNGVRRNKLDYPVKQAHTSAIADWYKITERVPGVVTSLVQKCLVAAARRPGVWQGKQQHLRVPRVLGRRLLRLTSLHKIVSGRGNDVSTPRMCAFVGCYSLFSLRPCERCDGAVPDLYCSRKHAEEHWEVAHRFVCPGVADAGPA